MYLFKNIFKYVDNLLCCKNIAHKATTARLLRTRLTRLLLFHKLYSSSLAYDFIPKNTNFIWAFLRKSQLNLSNKQIVRRLHQ